MKDALKDLWFLIPGSPDKPAVMGRVSGEVADGLYLCFYSEPDSPTAPGALITLDRMIAEEWCFYRSIFFQKKEDKAPPTDDGGSGET